MPMPVSVILTSTNLSSDLASTVTAPPASVNFRALSAMVLIMKSVSVLSAFTHASDGTTRSWMPFIWNPLFPSATMSNSACMGKLSMWRLSSPFRS